MKNRLAALLVTVILFSSCSDNDHAGSARLQIALVDAPADYKAVYIDVQDVQINSGDDENGWSSLEDFTPDIYDLLELTNGNEVILGDMNYPEGRLGQVRLILGSQNSLVTADDSVELKVPSGSQSGLKININERLEAGISYKLILDFDAAKSVVKAGKSGKYNLKPVIRAEMDAQSGAISGVVLPDTIQSTVYAIMGDDSLSTYTESGEYLISAVPEGTYEIVAVPEEESGFSKISLMDVVVFTGETIQADTLIYK